MATRFQLKRSSVGGVIPTTGDIVNAELAVNLSDRKLYTSDGSIVFEVGANLNNLSVSSNATLKGVVANGSLGAAGDVLHSNGTAIYWATDDAGVTSVASGNGLTGGPITSTGTLSVLANTGLVANSTGTFVNASYIATISANSATYLGAAGNLGNSSGIYTTGTINAASFTIGTSSIANATGFFTTGTVNGATISVGASVVANSSRFAIGTAVGLQANGGIGSAGQMLTSNGTTAYWSTPTTGTVTSVATGNGLTGGPITSTGTVSILANSGIIANSTGTFVFANTGLVANATGVHVNSTYIGTLSSNNASYLGGNLPAYYTNASNITTGTFPWAQAPAGTVNTSGSFTFSNNITYNANLTIAATGELIITAGAGIYANGLLGTAGQVLTSNASSVYWSTPSASGGGSTLTANNTDTQTFYVGLSNATSGTWSNAVVATSKLYFVPSSGTLSATIFTSLSDIKAKTDIVILTDALSVIKKIEGVSFKWKETNRKSYGVIAQQIEEILPEVVETNGDTKSVNYPAIIGFLIEAVKELSDRLDKLEGD